MREPRGHNWFVTETNINLMERVSITCAIVGAWVGIIMCGIAILGVVAAAGIPILLRLWPSLFTESWLSILRIEKSDMVPIIMLFSGGFAVIQITTQLADRRRVATTEYIDRLVYEWHKFVCDLCTHDTSVLNISEDQFSSLTSSDPVRVRVVHQFLRGLDLMSLIQTGAKYCKWADPDPILAAWRITFHRVVFSNPVALSLWREYEDTIEDNGPSSARRFIQSCVDYSDRQGSGIPSHSGQVLTGPLLGADGV